jgi:hypothetical protein
MNDLSRHKGLKFKSCFRSWNDIGSPDGWKIQDKIKIILHRIISVVWLTNFLSEIRSPLIHDDETQLLLLSVKTISKTRSSDHWWSHAFLMGCDGVEVVWVVFNKNLFIFNNYFKTEKWNETWIYKTTALSSDGTSQQMSSLSWAEPSDFGSLSNLYV